MKISTIGLAIIQKSEGCKLTSYRCPAGVLTIGTGHTGPDVLENETITQEEADMLLRRDVAQFERCVMDTCPLSTQSQFDAMVSLSFNIGAGAFKKSSVARLHNAGRYPEAQQSFALWNKVGGKVVGGLVTRRAREADRYDDDDLPTDVEAMPQSVQGEQPSRAVKGQVVAASATAITAAAGQVSDNSNWMTNLQEWGGWILPYVSDIKWLLVALVMGGIGYAMYARFNDRNTGRA